MAVICFLFIRHRFSSCMNLDKLRNSGITSPPNGVQIFKTLCCRYSLCVGTLPYLRVPLYESSAMRGLKVSKQNGIQIISIEKTGSHHA